MIAINASNVYLLLAKHISRHVIFNNKNFPYSSLFISQSSSVQQPNTNYMPLQIISPTSTSSVSKTDLPTLSSYAAEQSKASLPMYESFSRGLSSLNSSSHPSSTRYMIPSHIADFNHSMHDNSPSQTTDTTKYMLPPTNNNFTDSPIPPVICHPMITRSKKGIHKPKTLFTGVVTDSTKSQVPSNVSEALAHPILHKAVNEEIFSLHKNDTWTLVPFQSDLNLVGSKWVFRIKYKYDGSIEMYKERIVAQGFNQTFGLDYFETFSLVIKPATVRIIFAIAASLQWPIHSFDINNAFLNGTLKEDVFMTQPQGFEDLLKPHHVCKLKKALYGLKQVPRAWFEKLKLTLTAWGFRNSKADQSLFFFHQI